MSATSLPLRFVIEQGPPAAEALAEEVRRIERVRHDAVRRTLNRVRWALLLPCTAAAVLWLGLRPVLRDRGLWAVGADDALARGTVLVLLAATALVLLTHLIATRQLRRNTLSVSTLPTHKYEQVLAWRDKHPEIKRYLHAVAVEDLRPLLRGEHAAMALWAERAGHREALEASLAASRGPSGAPSFTPQPVRTIQKP